MLIELSVRNLAVFEDVRVPFGPGLNVVTGETGAGKSVLVEALRLALGEKADPVAVRSGGEEAEVAALFDLSGRDDLREALEEAGLPPADEVVVRRVIPASGRSRAYLNGRMVAQGLLSDLSLRLVELVSQHSVPLLLAPGAALLALDEFAGCGEKTRAMRSGFRRLCALRREAEEAATRAAAAAEALSALDVSIAELERAALVPGEEEEVAAELAAAKTVARLAEALRGAEEALCSSETSASAALSFAAARLKDAAGADPRLGDFVERVRALKAEAEELAREIGGRAARLDLTPERRERLEERLSEIRRLKRRYGKEVPELLAYLAEARNRRIRLSDALEESKRLRREVERLEREALEAAVAQSETRREAAPRLGAAVAAELALVDLPAARFRVEVTARPARAASLSSEGLDEVEFLFSANPGHEPRPLAQVASGGELSRVMLALRNASEGGRARRTLVFDEIDTGIGGKTAERVGARLKSLAARSQVICVTHLPQVAAFAESHILVTKSAQAGGVSTRVKPLGKQDRIEELARMLSGAGVTDKARRHARDLIEKAACG